MISMSYDIIGLCYHNSIWNLLFYHPWYYRVLNLWYCSPASEPMILMTYDIIGLWCHNQYHMKSAGISFMSSYPCHQWYWWLIISWEWFHYQYILVYCFWSQYVPVCTCIYHHVPSSLYDVGCILTQKMLLHS